MNNTYHASFHCFWPKASYGFAHFAQALRSQFLRKSALGRLGARFALQQNSRQKLALLILLDSEATENAMRMRASRFLVFEKLKRPVSRAKRARARALKLIFVARFMRPALRAKRARARFEINFAAKLTRPASRARFETNSAAK